MYVEVTKQGAQVLQVTNSRPVSGAASAGRRRSRRRRNFCSNGVMRIWITAIPSILAMLTVHFAPRQDGVYCYPDLIKVSVALDNGGLIGFQSEGYLMNHRIRDLPLPPSPPIRRARCAGGCAGRCLPISLP